MTEEKKLQNSEKIAGLNSEELFSSGHRACAGCGEALTLRHIMKAAGRNTIVVAATGCMEVVSTPFPQTAWEVPFIHVAFENIAAVASGIDSALKMQKKRDGINLLAIGGDGSSFDIGFGSLSGALERGHKFTYVCTDTEVYSNTGAQRSGATPFLANTTTSPAGKKIHGKIEPKKPLPLIIASHGIKYVATVSIANFFDLQNKMQKALAIDGPSFVIAYCPCPIGWQHDNSQTINLARLAIQTRVFPLYEIENGVLTFSQKIDEPKPLKDYFQLQGRFKHLSEEEIVQAQAYVNARYEFLLGIEGKKSFDVLY
jgi:pyruvate ferredoxin oxidoreductase beta subunit